MNTLWKDAFNAKIVKIIWFIFMTHGLKRFVGVSLGGVTNNTGVIPLFVISVRPDSVSRNANYVRLVMEIFDYLLRSFHSVPTKSSTERGKHL